MSKEILYADLCQRDPYENDAKERSPCLIDDESHIELLTLVTTLDMPCGPIIKSVKYEMPAGLSSKVIFL